ncbi:TIGR04141 family sporadically distributed protein [Xanthobacter sediminis]|uniref:TIGR04141 family sporadically distributed protein n=1 Tax=Xanthobacter sediminis TaxID=3119926 RepID=UPI00372A61C7
MADKTNKLTIYLIKSVYSEFSEIVEDGIASIEVPGVGTFYLESSHPRPPSWLSTFFKSTIDEALARFSLLTASAKGLLLIRLPDGDGFQIFALAFGHGRHLLRDDVVEERFGLKIVLNSVANDSLRSIDKVTLGSVPKQSREQISRESPAGSFGIDVEQDLISAVTGRSRLEAFGRTISGKDAFATSTKIDVENVGAFLVTCLQQFRSEDYKADFDWIDQIAEVRSVRKQTELNDAIVARFTEREYAHIWMVPPEIVDWADAVGFRYGRRKRAELVPDIDVAGLVTEANDEPITLEWLKKTSIYLISARTDDVLLGWPAFRCLYAELELDGYTYVLNGGKWYAVAANFAQQVKNAFVNVPDADCECPSYAHINEGEYNEYLSAALQGSCCLDADLIQYGGGSSSIEFCDVLTIDKKLIHVKRYSGSSQLSHLFSQGAVSGELFMQDAAFRAKLNEKLEGPHKLEDPRVRPIPQDYEIVFAIISKSPRSLDIPFFSKVTLRNACRRLEGYGYKVSKKKIPTVY